MSVATSAGARAWVAGFETIAGETPDEVALPVEGQLPADVAGTLFRIGPAAHDVGGERYRHWFDGDGMVHALRLGPDGAHYRSRFVATAGRRAEEAAGRRLFAGGFSTPPPGNAWYRLRHARPKNVANINVIAHAGAVHALWEGGRPHRIDPDTLETLGPDDLGGLLGPGEGFSAHPKPDPATGEVWNFGLAYGARTMLSIYRADAAGCWSRVARHSLERPYMVHDMALTPTSVVLVLAPVALPRIPIGLISGRRGYGESLRYEPRWGTTILVVDRRSGACRELRAEPFMVFHLAGAREDGDALEVELCSYPDLAVVRELGEVMRGQAPASRPRLERLRVDGAGRVTRAPIGTVPLEFPRRVGQDRVVGVTVGEGAEFFNTPAVVDTATGEVTCCEVLPWQFAGEVVPVARRWGLTFVLDGAARSTQLQVLDLGDLAAGPVATVRLPQMVPFGLHGNFVPAPA